MTPLDDSAAALLGPGDRRTGRGSRLPAPEQFPVGGCSPRFRDFFGRVALIVFDPTEELALHEGAAPLGFLLGAWRGSGTVRFHSIEPTEFEEEIRFSHKGRSWIRYEQDSWRADDGTPLHFEMGVWRMVGPEQLNTFIALTAGVDFCVGSLDGTTITLQNTTSPTAEGVERIISLHREYRVDGDDMEYFIEMGTDQQPHGGHVTARLTRVSHT